MTVIAAPRHEGDWRGYADVVAQAFGEDRAAAHASMAAEPVRGAVVRLAREGDAVVGGTLAYRVEQLFGARPVPAGAVANVAVLPQARGRGVALDLMRALEAAMREAGLAVSPLWPSTTALYRRAGWEVAGLAARHAVRTAALAGRGAPGRPLPEPPLERVHRLQRDRAEAWDGPLVRPAWWWSLRQPSGQEGLFRYGWEEDGALTGHLAYRHVPAGDAGYGLRVLDLWTATPGALAGLTGLLGSHGAVAPETSFAPSALPLVHDLLWSPAAGDVRVTEHAPWMLKLIDPAAAVAARGWPAGARGRAEIALAGPAGAVPRRHVLEVHDGSATLTPGGAGTLGMGSRGLAAWYAGALGAPRAARLGLMDGPPEALEALDALLDPRPAWLPELF